LRDIIDNATISIFIRGSAGAYWGVQGSIHYRQRLGDNFDPSWDKVSGELSGATGVWGISIEVGAGLRLSVCKTVA